MSEDTQMRNRFEEAAYDNGYRKAIEDAAKVALEMYPRGSAHTYASENADLYHAQEGTCEEIAKRIKALLTESAIPNPCRIHSYYTKGCKDCEIIRSYVNRGSR